MAFAISDGIVAPGSGPGVSLRTSGSHDEPHCIAENADHFRRFRRVCPRRRLYREPNRRRYSNADFSLSNGARPVDVYARRCRR